MDILSKQPTFKFKIHCHSGLLTAWTINIKYLMIYMKKLFDSDWLSAVPFQGRIQDFEMGGGGGWIFVIMSEKSNIISIFEG